MPSTPAALRASSPGSVSLEHAFERWVHAGGPYGLWAKPVLFAPPPSTSLAPQAPLDWPKVDVTSLAPFERTAFVLDVPGTQALTFAMALAAKGVAPVPLFNGVFGNGVPILNVRPLAQGLLDLVDALDGMSFPDRPSPAFLLDADRMSGSALPGRFDNRWLTFPQDFPSVRFLVDQGITRVVVVSLRAEIRDDLAHVLVRWQKGGLGIHVVNEKLTNAPALLSVKAPSGFRRTWYRALAKLGLRENTSGGFGGHVPEASSGGGG